MLQFLFPEKRHVCDLHGTDKTFLLLIENFSVAKTTLSEYV